MRRLISSVASSLAFAGLGSSVGLYTSPDQLPAKEYDFIIAGGGTAGCVLAARLSEHSDVSVLLVEAGGDHRTVFNSIIPFLAASLIHTEVDWNYTTIPQPGFANRTIMFERGHVLGGSSTVNYMSYNRASDDYYDTWAKSIGDDRWSWKSLEPFFKRSHKLVEPADGHDYSKQVIGEAHGNGPVDISVLNSALPLDELVIKASEKMGGRFRSNQDINAGDSLGFTYIQTSIGNGERSSAATAYLDPLFSSGRKNLDIIINTQVTKLIASDKVKGKQAFKTAELSQPDPGQKLAADDESEIRSADDGKRYTIYAKKEVILSAGVIGTPKILQLSGIGPKAALQNLGIETRLDIPDVGKNLTDHPMSILYFSAKTPIYTDVLLRNPSEFGKQIQAWQETRKGIMATTASATQTYMRLPRDHPIFAEVSDPSSGPRSGHTELLFGEGMIPFTDIPMPESGDYVFVLAVLTSPTSRGDMLLTSSNAFASPSINPNYLATDFDRAAIVQAIRDTFTFLKHDTFRDYVGAPLSPLSRSMTDEELYQYTAAHGVTINHGIGTAKMSPFGADWGVVNPDLKVKGTVGLRIVDASVFTEIPEVHTMAPVYIVAERAADIVLEEYGLLKQTTRDEL